LFKDFETSLRYLYSGVKEGNLIFDLNRNHQKLNVLSLGFVSIIMVFIENAIIIGFINPIYNKRI